MRVPVVRFEGVVGSMTSNDGKTFYYRVRHKDGTEAMLGFPHCEISNLVETAAMQMDHGRDDEGVKVATAFTTNGFLVGRGPKGELTVTMIVGDNGRINFVLTHGMAEQLEAALVRGLTKH